MRLEQHNELASRDTIFVGTLPFDQHSIKRYITDAILQRTKKRWAWFAVARDRNPSLGTLSYLPLEIRQLIWQTMLHCRDTLSSNGLWEYEFSRGQVFNLSAYYFGFGRKIFAKSKIENLRLVSSSMKVEYDEIFLKKPFRFNQVANLMAFLDRMPEYYLSQLDSVEIGVCTLSNVDCWIALIARLPNGLRKIHFRVYPTISWWKGQTSKNSLEPLEKLIRSVSRDIPNATIAMSSTDEGPLSEQCQNLLDDLLSRP